MKLVLKLEKLGSITFLITFFEELWKKIIYAQSIDNYLLNIFFFEKRISLGQIMLVVDWYFSKQQLGLVKNY